jgi:hypothetical protein
MVDRSGVVSREKRAAAKAQGRKNADSDEDYISEPDSPVADANGDGKDFFQSVDDSGFDDPFFKVRSMCLTIWGLSATICRRSQLAGTYRSEL